MELIHELPAKLIPLQSAARYKVLYGGRGGAKSWGIARQLLLDGYEKPLRILCAREFQSSIRESVHRLLADQIHAMGMGEFYEIQNAVIRGKNGTEFGFEGLKHNITKIKSYEGADRVWVEEAQAVSRASWNTLIPTIRKPGSEIWMSFNPELDTDETYQRFVANPPKDAVIIKMGYQDNPWFPEVLREEMEAMKLRDYSSYLNIWEGECRPALEGAIYANELRAATEQRRIVNVPYAQEEPVHAFFDIGWADNTSIWFAQKTGMEYRLLSFYENSQQPIEHYLKELQRKAYKYHTIWLPHDARAKSLQTGRSIEEVVRSSGYNVEIVPQLSVADGINAARTIFSQCWFDANECVEGINALRHYQYDYDKERDVNKKKPLHNWASNGADAFRYFALGMPARTCIPSEKPLFQYSSRSGASDTSWMAG